MEFIALDVETANEDSATICQVGMARFKADDLVDEWSCLVDPESSFSSLNIGIHGIRADDVAGVSAFPEIASRLYAWLDGRIVVCHSHFDKTAMKKACERYGLRMPTCDWLDSAKVARRTWRNSGGGYGLGTLCNALGHEFSHHDALEDAKAAAFILKEACRLTGVDVSRWMSLVRRPIARFDLLPI